MTSSTDLAKAMKASLEEHGDLTMLRVQLEEEMLAALHQMQATGKDSECPSLVRKSKPPMPPEIILVNNLVVQYLNKVGLKRTSEVLCCESGLPGKSVPIHILSSAFPTVVSSDDRPLLSIMINDSLNQVEK